MAVYTVILSQIKGLTGSSDGKGALIFSFIWIKNLSWKVNVILQRPLACGTVHIYVYTYTTLFHM